VTTTYIELPGTTYNIIHGTNRYAFFWLGMLGLPPDVLGEFRDCFLQRNADGALEICIYTRNGGVHRQTNALATEMLRTHPRYIRDCDDEHDPTYASYIFRPDEHMRPTLELMVLRDTEHAIPGSHHERAQAFLHRIDRRDDPDVQRIRAVMKAVVPRVVVEDQLTGRLNPFAQPLLDSVLKAQPT
jgi:hypothetical protein